MLKILYQDWIVYRIAKSGGFSEFILKKSGYSNAGLQGSDFDELNDIYLYAHICNRWWMREKTVAGFYDIETNADFFAAATGNALSFPGSSSGFFSELRTQVMKRFVGFETGTEGGKVVRVLPHPLYNMDYIVVLENGAKINGQPLCDKKRQPLDTDSGFDIVSDRWYRDSTSVYTLTDSGSRSYFVKLKKANIAEFQPLGEYYAYDDKYVFYVTGRAFKRGGGKPSLLPTKLHTIFGEDERLHDSLLARDESKVYFGGKEVKNALPESYRQIDYDYFTDGKRVFYGNIEIEGADPDSFIVTSERTAMDKFYQYFGSTPTDNE